MNQPILQKTGKIVVVMPAYNAGETLTKTYAEIPSGWVDEVILVDDCSHDNTLEIAKSLNLKCFTHRWNRGYGGNQKTCYNEALESGADVIIMLHPDYQYDPTIIPDMAAPILRGEADVVFASRFHSNPRLGGMPMYKFVCNRLLTRLQNITQGTRFTECHTGYRAYSRKILESIPYERNSEGFVFDNEIIGQFLMVNARFREIPVKTRYEKDSSTVSLKGSIVYGFGVLWTMLRFMLNNHGIIKCHKFNFACPFPGTQDTTCENLRGEIKKHFETIAPDYDEYKYRASYYYDQLKKLLQELIPGAGNQRVLEIGCGTGSLLADLQPRKGLGIDISENMIEIAKKTWKDHPNIQFETGEAEHLLLHEDWDVAVMVDVLEHLYDPDAAISVLAEQMTAGSKLIITWANYLWTPILNLLEFFGLKMPEGPHNWEGPEKILNRLKTKGFELKEHGTRCILPARIPGADCINKFAQSIPVFKNLGVVRYIVAQKTGNQ